MDSNIQVGKIGTGGREKTSNQVFLRQWWKEQILKSKRIRWLERLLFLIGNKILYAEYIMRNTGLEEAQAGIKIAGRNTNNLWQHHRYGRK